jgi:hypothetical protein
MVSEVGIEAAVKRRLLVRLMVRACPVGTVIITGDHPAAAGFRLTQVAVDPVTAAPQV